MKILILLNSIRVSGTEKLMIELAERFERAGNRTYLFPLITPFDQKFKFALSQAGKTLNILFPSYIEKFDSIIWKLNGLTLKLVGWSFRTYLLRRFLIRQIQNENIDLIVSNSYPTDLFIQPIAQTTKTKYVIVDHGAYCNYLQDKTSFDDKPIKRSAVLVGVSKWVVGELGRLVPEKNSVLIYNGHVPSLSGNDFWFKNQISSKNHFVFCMHGRGTEQKGWRIAIEAWRILKSKGFLVKLILLSEGQYITSLKEEFGKDTDLIFGGFVYNLKDILTYVDVGLVLSRKYEAFGLTVLDYFDSEIPVVASNLGGIPEVVNFQNLNGGLLVSMSELAEPIIVDVVAKMEILMLDKVGYRSYSKQAKSIASHFSIDKCANEYLNLFDSIIKA